MAVLFPRSYPRFPSCLEEASSDCVVHQDGLLPSPVFIEPIAIVTLNVIRVLVHEPILAFAQAIQAVNAKVEKGNINCQSFTIETFHV